MQEGYTNEVVPENGQYHQYRLQFPLASGGQELLEVELPADKKVGEVLDIIIDGLIDMYDEIGLPLDPERYIDEQVRLVWTTVNHQKQTTLDPEMPLAAYTLGSQDILCLVPNTLIAGAGRR